MCAENLEGIDYLGKRNCRVGQPLLEVLDAIQEDKEVVILALVVDSCHLCAATSHVCVLILGRRFLEIVGCFIVDTGMIEGIRSALFWSELSALLQEKNAGGEEGNA